MSSKPTFLGGWIRKAATTTVVAKMGPFPREEYVVLMKDEAEKINCGSDKKFWPQRTHNSFKIDWTTRYRPEVLSCWWWWWYPFQLPPLFGTVHVLSIYLVKIAGEAARECLGTSAVPRRIKHLRLWLGTCNTRTPSILRPPTREWCHVWGLQHFCSTSPCKTFQPHLIIMSWHIFWESGDKEPRLYYYILHQDRASERHGRRVRAFAKNGG